MRRISLLLVIIALASRSNNKIAKTLEDVETYIKERPDSALEVIRSIDTSMLTSQRLRAHYSLLHSIALDKNWIDTTDKNVVTSAVKYYDRHPSGIKRAKAWYYLGRIQQNGGAFTDAGISFLKAEKYAGSCGDDSFMALVYQAISNVYNKNYYNEEALRYTELAYEYAMAAGDSANANNSLFCMATDLNNVGRFQESDSLFRAIIESGSANEHIRSSVLSNYALNLAHRDTAFEEAVSYFEEVIKSYGSLRRLNHWGAYAYSLTRTGHVEKANAIFEKVERKQKNSYSFLYWKSLAEAYLGNDKSAYELQKAAADIQLENLNKVLKQSAVKAQKDFLEQAAVESEKSSRRKQIIAWSSAGFLFIFAIVMLIVFIRRGKRIRQEREELLQSYREMTDLHWQMEEEKAKVRRQYIRLFQSYFCQVGRVNEILYAHSNESGNKLFQELRQSFQRVGNDKERQKEFEKILDDSFDGIMTKFRAAFPDKRERTYQLASYLFAGFDTVTICTVIPELNKHNVHVEKSRIKASVRDSDSVYKDKFLEQLS